MELNRRMGGGRTLELVVDRDFPDGLSAAAGIEVMRVVQEALANVRRHSGAGRATVTLGLEADEVRVDIEDDGCGFGPDTSPGIGLTGMRERVRGLGGRLEVESEEGAGTRVRMRVALPALTAGDAGELSNA